MSDLALLESLVDLSGYDVSALQHLRKPLRLLCEHIVALTEQVAKQEQQIDSALAWIDAVQAKHASRETTLLNEAAILRAELDASRKETISSRIALQGLVDACETDAHSASIVLPGRPDVSSLDPPAIPLDGESAAFLQSSTGQGEDTHPPESISHPDVAEEAQQEHCARCAQLVQDLSEALDIAEEGRQRITELETAERSVAAPAAEPTTEAIT